MSEIDEIQTVTSNSEKLIILRFAQYKFFSEGFRKITISQLALQLGISKSTIYKFYPTKEHLIKEAVYDVIHTAKNYINDVLNTRSNAVEKLCKILEYLSNTISRFQSNWLRDVEIHAPFLWKEIDEFRKKMMIRNISKIIEQGKREKLFENYPSEIVITIFISSLRAVVNPQFLLNMRETYNEIIDYTFQILLNGILTSKGKKIFKQLKAKQK